MTTDNYIIEKYNLKEGSILVNHEEGTLGVDCWFDTDTVRQHRVVAYDDYTFFLLDRFVYADDREIGMWDGEDV